MSAVAPAPRRFPLYQQILVAMVVGAVLGLVLGPRAAPLGEFGRIVIQLIKALAAPLLFFAIVDALIKTHIKARSFGTLLLIAAINGTIAVSLGLGLSNWLRPGDHFPKPTLNGANAFANVKSIDFVKAVTGHIPESLPEPFVKNAIISLVLLALLLGFALRRYRREQEKIGATGHELLERFVAASLRLFEIMLTWIIALIPLAVFGVVARTVGEQGFKPLVGLGIYVGVVVLGLAVHIGIVYQAWILFVARRSLAWFWGGARDALVYVLGSSSSLATLPITLRCLDDMRVTPQSARLASCVGNNLNHDGILLYEAMAVLFVAQVHGIDLSLGQQFLAAISCIVAGIGIAGVPEAGLISLALVLATVGLPTEILPLLLTVDWILSRCRAFTNVTNDMVAAVLLDRFGGRDGESGLPRPAGDAVGR